MTKRLLAVGCALIAVGGAVGAETDATSASLPDLRGFGRVKVERGHGNDAVSVMRFECEDEQKAETVAGKFLWDLRREPGVEEKDGIFSRPGAAFAVERDGKTTTIYSAESREALEAFLATKNTKKHIDSADCPGWMKRFGWGMYGMGGFENFHNWMDKAKKYAGIDPKKDKTPLDPMDDIAFLREMASARDGAEPMAFDNWLDDFGTDFAPGIPSRLSDWKIAAARETGTPTAFRVYAGFGANNTWGVTGADLARHGAHLAQPPDWLGSAMVRRDAFSQFDTFHDKGWVGLAARRVHDAMERVLALGAEPRGWMLPCGELGGNATVRWHQDYGPAARKSWREWRIARGLDGDVPLPEFATFAGLGGLALDLAGDWLTRAELDSQPNDADWWRRPPEERYPGLAGRWYAEDADLSAWRTIRGMPGSWEFGSLYSPAKDSDGRKVDSNTCSRWFRRGFEWRGADGAGRRIYLYFHPLANTRHYSEYEHKGAPGNVPRRHQLFVNGRKAGEVGMSWGALDVTDLLREGANTVALRLSGNVWSGRIFLSTEAPESYPFSDPSRTRLWDEWQAWRCESWAGALETLFDAMRQVDPDAPIKWMAPNTIGRPLVHRLCRDWGAWGHFTGEGSWFYPWNKRYGRLWGVQGTSELAGPSKGAAGMSKSALRVFMAGLDGHEPVFLTQTYSRNPELRAWWIAHKELLSRMGTYDIELCASQILLYRRTLLADATCDFPDPYPDAPNAVGRKGAMESPWNHDFGRGTLQSLGYSHLYIDDDGLLAGKADPYPLIIDCASEIVPPAEAEALRRWVEAGGTFVALPCTGRSTPPEDAAPIRALLAANADAGSVRPVGKGRVVMLDDAFWSGIEDEGGVFNAKRGALERVRALLKTVGFQPPLVETDDPEVRATPYRSNSGLDAVAVLCNFNEVGKKKKSRAEAQRRRETVVRLRCGRKPQKIVGYAGVDILSHKEQEKQENKENLSTFQSFNFSTFDWDEAEGVATVKIALPPQEVAVLNAVGVHDPGDAVAYWWRDNVLKWPALKKPSFDLAPYREGEWKEPTQDLKDGWRLASLREIPLDILQFSGVPRGEGATLRKVFDVADAGWLADGGRTYFVCGARHGRNFLTPVRLWLNGEELTAGDMGSARIMRDVTDALRPSGNELVVEIAGGADYTGMTGTIHLYHREKPVKSVELDVSAIKDGAFSFLAPAEWRGRYRVRLFIDGANTPLGVRVNDRRFSKGHDSNFAQMRDFDITDFVRFGGTNRVALGHQWNAAPRRYDISALRIDLYDFSTER